MHGTGDVTKGGINCAIQHRPLQFFGNVAAVTTLYVMSYDRISAVTLTASLNGTGATYAYLTTNQSKTILAKVLKAVQLLIWVTLCIFRIFFIRGTL